MGGRDHTSHRLVALGLSERQAVLLLYLVSALAGAIAVFAYRYGLSVAVLFIALLALGLLIFGRFLFRLAVYPDAAPATEAPSLLRQVADFTYTRQIGTVLIDLLLIVLAYHAAYLLRFEERYELELAKFLESLPIVLAVQLFALALLRTYQGVWRYTGLTDVLRLARGVALGTAGSVVVLVFLYRFEGYSRTVFVLDGLVLIVLLAGSRLALRALDELLRPVPAHFRRALIYGAGDGGVLALREIRNNAALELTPVGFLDDDRSKHRSSILGTPVLGGIDRLEEVIARHQVSDVIIASAKIDPATVDRVARACDTLGVRVSRATLTLH
jgi:UDP-GlcNAc:undecaprenyl-phosphate GlcNAc-1-phosphate transferase